MSGSGVGVGMFYKARQWIVLISEAIFFLQIFSILTHTSSSDTVMVLPSH